MPAQVVFQLLEVSFLKNLWADGTFGELVPWIVFTVLGEEAYEGGFEFYRWVLLHDLRLFYYIIKSSK
jgi:hypothetical protein